MSEKDKREIELKERYIYQVIRRIPKKQREEIRMELNELIDDMCEHSSMEQVLVKLGNPGEFAKQYRDENCYIVGPGYYDDYMGVLKIVFICVLLSAILSAVVNGITAQSWSAGNVSAIVNGTVDILVNIMTDTVGTLIAGSLTALGGVTLIFAILERQNKRSDIRQKQEKSWSLDKLPPVPDKKAFISRSDSVIGLVFIMLFGAILIFVRSFSEPIFWKKRNLSGQFQFLIWKNGI